MNVVLAATASYLPSRWQSAAELGSLCGIPADVLTRKFGLTGKHVAAEDEHASDLAIAAGRALLDEHGIDPAGIGAVVYFGSTWKDHPVWQAAPRVAHELGCREAFALELDYVSCGSPVALRVARALLAAEEELTSVLLVAGARESYLLDHGNDRARFALTFGDGAVAALLVRGKWAGDRDGGRAGQAGAPGEAEVLGSHMITDGSLARHVRVPAGGSVEPATAASVADRRHFLDVTDPVAMKERLDAVSLPNFAAVAKEATKRSGATLADLDYVCGIHIKPSMHAELLDRLGVPAIRAAYLDDTGHMSGVDPLFAYDRARRRGALEAGRLVLTLAAGTGYTWAATVLRVGR